MPAKIVTPEACQVAQEILDRFCQWANERIADYEDERSRGYHTGGKDKVNTLIFAQRNLLKIVRDVTGVEE